MTGYSSSETLWVFCYGSLIWSPEFEPVERVPAKLSGWERRFCMQSISYRGTVEKPGLVLALDRASGSHCNGLAFSVKSGREDQVLAGLRARELARPAYLELWEDLDLVNGKRVQAVTYVVNTESEHYCNFSFEKQVEIISSATGLRGPNRDYLWNTAKHLREYGIEDPSMEKLVEQTRKLSQIEAS